MSSEVCSDDRFELIEKAKSILVDATNIEMCPDEMAAIDSILFRCWQMGWLDKLHDDDSRMEEAVKPIVRCRDCIFYVVDNLGGYCTLIDFQVADGMEGGFCAWGRTDERNIDL